MSRLFELSDLLNKVGIKYKYADEYEGEDAEILINLIINVDNKLKFVNSLISKNTNIKRGDIVHYGDDSYRNNGKLIWNGNTLEKLDEEMDEYWNLPFSYTLNEFPNYNHFEKTIDHNNIRWIRLDNPESISAIHPIKYTVHYNNKMGKYFVVSIKGRDYTIVVPHKYLNINDTKELYHALIGDEDFKMKEHNNCLALEIDDCLIGLTGIDTMYVIYADGGTYRDDEDIDMKLDEDIMDVWE